VTRKEFVNRSYAEDVEDNKDEGIGDQLEPHSCRWAVLGLVTHDGRISDSSLGARRVIEGRQQARLPAKSVRYRFVACTQLRQAVRCFERG
jgi:hypothetical protein